MRLYGEQKSMTPSRLAKRERQRRWVMVAMAFLVLTSALSFAEHGNGWVRVFQGVMFVVFLFLFVAHWRRWGYSRFSNGPATPN
jgi:cobalamin synthase